MLSIGVAYRQPRKGKLNFFFSVIVTVVVLLSMYLLLSYLQVLQNKLLPQCLMLPLLLLSLFWIMKLTTPLFTLMGQEISGRDIVLIAGGLFLIAKSTLELHSHATNQSEEESISSKVGVGFVMTIIQIGILDIVFSLDSVITAVGMANHIEIMILAVILAVGVMLLASGAISRFVESNPTIKVLALAFLILIGVALVGEGLEFHIPKGYIYFAMAFSLVVEMINLYSRRKQNG